MKSEFKTKEATAKIKKIALARLELAGAFVETEAKKRVPKDSGFLMDSITHEVFPNRLTARIQTNAVYGAMQELGGVIEPDTAGALTIPVHPDAKGKKASDFPDLFMIKTKAGKALLVRNAGGPRSQRIDIMFVLVKSVKIPAQPYLRPAVYENKEKITKLMQL